MDLESLCPYTCGGQSKTRIVPHVVQQSWINKTQLYSGFLFFLAADVFIPPDAIGLASVKLFQVGMSPHVFISTSTWCVLVTVFVWLTNKIKVNYHLSERDMLFTESLPLLNIHIICSNWPIITRV